LAEAIGVSEDTMGAIESGRRKIDVGELIEIAKTLDVHPMKLLQRILEW
jgi:DNA-binding XRE family transcriptional regulator